jgi:hypothetical protein
MPPKQAHLGIHSATRLEVRRDTGQRLTSKRAGVAGQQLGEHLLVPPSERRYRLTFDERDRSWAQLRDLGRVSSLPPPKPSAPDQEHDQDQDLRGSEYQNGDDPDWHSEP